MNANTEAIFREFPFLEEHYKRGEVKKARVSRVTPELLAQRENGKAGEKYEIFSWMNYGKILLFDKNGHLLGRVGKKLGLSLMLYYLAWPIVVWFFPAPCSEESIGQAILRFGKEAHYIVWLMYDNGSSITETNGELIVYKSPKGYTIQKWYEEQILRAEEDVRAEVTSIDRQAIA